MDSDLEYRVVVPDASLALFVDSFWMLHNKSAEAKQVVGLPDGRIDLFFSCSEASPFNVVLIGAGTRPDSARILPGTLMFAVSFRLPAVEHVLRFSVADLVDGARQLPDSFWNFGPGALTDFDAFCGQAVQKIKSLLPEEIDERQRRLFSLVYASKGALSIQELAAQSFWTARQINRYFNEWFGISLKKYCSILRFRASLEHIAKGRLFPELDFADQNHFIKEVKRFSGVIPKDLFRNQNDRFILLSAIRQQ